MIRRTWLLATAMALTLSASAASAIEPVGDKGFNVETSFDLKTLTPDNFYDVVVPAAKKEGTVVLFDFAASFEPLFRDKLLPAFEAKYGVTVDYQRGQGDAATQQLVATYNAGAAAPFDVMFVSAGTVAQLNKTDAVARIPLNRLLPNALPIDEEIATTVEGIRHGGNYLPFHRNQTSIVYDSRAIATADVPADAAALLAWAKQHPGKLAVTHPAKGGSGDGFMQVLMLSLIKDKDCRAKLTDFGIDAAAAKAFVASDCVKPVWDYYRQIMQVAELTSGNSDTLNLVANSEASIGTTWEDMTFDLLVRGLMPPTVRQYLLADGMVGGGDGFYLPAKATHPAAALLLMDFLLSPESQATKLTTNGSRSPLKGIDFASLVSAEDQERLIPLDQFATRAVAKVPRPIINAGKDYFQDNLLRR